MGVVPLHLEEFEIYLILPGAFHNTRGVLLSIGTPRHSFHISNPRDHVALIQIEYLTFVRTSTPVGIN